MKISILIPTFNRKVKVISLLNSLNQFINSKSEYVNSYEIIISDNCSTDGTKEAINEFISDKSNFMYYQQTTNVGFDSNVKFLYDKSKLDYVWYLSDDDIVNEDALGVIISVLSSENPDVLLFSFAQPRESKILTFNVNEPFENIFQIDEIVKYVAYYPKLSIYVLKRVDLNIGDNKLLDAVIGNGYYFVSLAFSILSKSKNPQLTLISKQLASCDDDFKCFSINPDVFLNFYKTFDHPFVNLMGPKFIKQKMELSYVNTLEYLFKIKEGVFIVNDINFYNGYIKKFRFNSNILLTNPLLLIQFVLLKLGLVKYYLKFGNPFYLKVIKPLRNFTKFLL
jgi:glycosyltransferase involved in cell wall biosynthesis